MKNKKDKQKIVFLLALFLTFGTSNVPVAKSAVPLFTLNEDPSNPFIFNMNTTYDTGNEYLRFEVKEYYCQVELKANTPYVFIFWSSVGTFNLTLQKSDGSIQVFSENERDDTKFIITFETCQSGTYNLTIDNHKDTYRNTGGLGFYELLPLEEATDLFSYTLLSGYPDAADFTIAYIEFEAVMYFQVGYSHSSCYLLGGLGTEESVSQALNASSDLTFQSDLTFSEAGRYVVYSFDDRIYKIYGPTGGDDPIEDIQPTASFTVSNTTVEIDEEVIFTDASTGGNVPLSFFWDFGDGTNSTEQNSTHSYDTDGNYTVNLTVTDFDGDFSSYYVEIDVFPAPTSDDTLDDPSTDDDPNDTPNSGIPGFSIGILVFSAGLMVIFLQKGKAPKL